MNAKDQRSFAKRKDRIERRLDKSSLPKEEGTVLSGANYRYEIGDRVLATKAGGIGAIHAMVRRLGLIQAIDQKLNVLKLHMPYYESDHVLNIAYNLLAGGTCLEDLETLRQDEAYLNMLGAVRIPDPTTAGDFVRRLSPEDITTLMDVVNAKRQEIWRRQPKSFLRRAVIEGDGVMAPTEGEKKAGMDISHKGIWGYHPLMISLANSQEPLYLVNRSGNVPSHTGAAEWFDRAIDLCKGVFDEVVHRGDTDFSLTGKFDEWSARGVGFVFGYDANPKVSQIAEDLAPAEWEPLFRPERDVPKYKQRRKRENTKDDLVIQREYETIRLLEEHIAEFEYRPIKCGRSYRMIVLKKILSVERGQPLLIPNDDLYFFYVTNNESLSKEEVVFEANSRCNQENLIEQLKCEVNALHAPVNDLNSNWAYMVIASLAWTFKAWFALLQPRALDCDALLRMEFKKFLTRVLLIPSQIIMTARRIHVRLLGYTHQIRLLFASLKATGKLRLT